MNSDGCVFDSMKTPALKAWTLRESKLGNPALKAELDKTNLP